MRKWMKIVESNESNVEEDLEFDTITDNEIILSDPMNHEVEVLMGASEEEKDEILDDLEAAIMEAVNRTLDEAPIADVTHVGNWEKNSSFGTQDRKLLNNEKAITKIKAMWKYPEDVDTNVFLVNSPEARKFTEIGEVDMAWMEKNMPTTLEGIRDQLRDDQINILFTNNTGSERVPLTGWVMAHRFGHALQRDFNGKTGAGQLFKDAAETIVRYFGDLQDDYGVRQPSRGASWGSQKPAGPLDTNILRGLFHAVCTFRSAREGNLRNPYEAVYEMFAQYIVTGEIKFNDLPKSFKYGSTVFRFRNEEENYDYTNRGIQEDLSYELVNYYESVCHYAVGKIYVM